MKIANIKIDKQFVVTFVQSLFICVALVLAVVLGRLSMSQEIQVLLDYSCEGTRIEIDESTNTITVNPDQRPLTDPDYWANFSTTTTTNT